MSASPRTRGGAGAALAAVAVVIAAAVLATPAAGSTTPSPGPVTIADERVTESSGLAASRRHAHTVWTTNDSGDEARLFAVDTSTGETVGVHRYAAPVRDVEALAVTGGGRVLVGDIGDNTASRDLVRIFWFDEPDLGETSGGWASWECTYPDGAHDAEALAVDPVSGRVVVVTKGERGGIYALPESPTRQGVNRMEKVGTVDARVTDAAYLPDGSALLVRTYTSLLVLDPDTFEVASTSRLPLQPQGETLTALADGSLLVGSEGTRSRLLPVKAPRAPGATTAPSTSTPTGGPTTATGANGDRRDVAAGEQAGREVVRGGWRWVVAAGALLCLALGAGLLLRDSRRAGPPTG